MPVLQARHSHIYTYEAHLESSEHGIITPQCFYKMLSSKHFWKLDDGIFFLKMTRRSGAVHAHNE